MNCDMPREGFAFLTRTASSFALVFDSPFCGSGALLLAFVAGQFCGAAGGAGVTAAAGAGAG